MSIGTLPFYKSDWWPLVLQDLGPPELLQLARVNTDLHNTYSVLPEWESFLARDFALYTSNTFEATKIEFRRIKCIALNYTHNLCSGLPFNTQRNTFVPEIHFKAQFLLKNQIPSEVTSSTLNSRFYCFYKTTYKNLAKSAEFKLASENPLNSHLPFNETYEHAYSPTTPVLHLEWITDLRTPGIFQKYYRLLGLFRNLIPAIDEGEEMEQNILNENYVQCLTATFSPTILARDLTSEQRSVLTLEMGANRFEDPDDPQGPL